MVPLLEERGDPTETSSDPKLRRERARLHQKKAHRLYLLIRACEQFAPNGAVRKQLKELEQRWRWNFGAPSTAQRIQSEFILAKAAGEKVRNFLNPRNREIPIEPAKKYLYAGGIGPDHDGRVPYRLVYLNRDRGYELNRSLKGVQEALFGGITALANRFDRLRGREIDPSLTATAKGLRPL